MDSWTLQGDSYSFLHSAPRTLSLCHRDGTPNHVEIFDIINVPSQRSAISETTCLCDIFGDDCEPPPLSSSPALRTLVQREVDGTTAASPLTDDLNSSGSYHTAPGSIEGEEGLEDPAERLQSPLLQTESSERRESEGDRLSSELSKDSSSNLESKSKSPVPLLSAASPSSEVINAVCGERTPSVGHNSPSILTPERTLSSFYSSSVKTRGSLSLLNPRKPDSEGEPKRISPLITDKHNPAHQSSTQSPSPELPINCVSSSSSESVNTQSLAEFGEAEVSPGSRSSYFSQNNSPSPRLGCKDYSLDFISSNLESRGNISPSLPSSSHTELLSQSRETPEPKNRSHSIDTHSLSPFPELRGRVSLPDLFSRDSTPDVQDSPHLISDSDRTGRDSSTTPESRDTAETSSAISTPGPQYTPPSPVISFTPSPEPGGRGFSPEVKQAAPSPDLLSAASPAKSWTRTPSPAPLLKISHISTPSEISTQVSSSVVSSPSPEVRSNCSPIEYRYTSPSPEIRIIASSPEVSRKEHSSEVETISNSSLQDPEFEFTSLRSPTSSPHITGISYSVVEPEDRCSPPFTELSRLSTPEFDKTRLSPEARSPTPSRESTHSSIAGCTGTPRDSPHASNFASSVLQPEIAHQSRYRTPSPQPKHHTPSPEPTCQTPSSDKYQSPSFQHTSRNPSPAAPSPERRYQQHSPFAISTEPSPHSTPEIKSSSSSFDITEVQYPIQLETESLSTLVDLDKEGKPIVAEIKSYSPVVTVQLPASTSPFLAEGKIDRSPKQSTEEETSLQHNSGLASLYEQKQDTGPNIFQIENPHNYPPIENKSLSTNFLFCSEGGVQQISPVRKTVQKLEDQQCQSSNSITSESSSSLKSDCTPENPRRQLSTKFGCENRERFTEDMSHNLNKRRTPSPPITRFTPVHIIAPEKPYRQWQNRIPPQVGASSQSGYLKKLVTNRESPDADNNSQPNWVRLGKQLEIERKMQEEREIGRQRQRGREMGRAKKTEGQDLEKGEELKGGARGEQVELSFTAKNRKGPVSRSAAPTSRETSQGLPTAHSCSESLFAARQPQQQQSLLRLPSQQDTKGGVPSRRLQPLAPQNKISARVVVNRPCQSSSSSMGSEFDEADNEVKWFTDSAFSSLSSPEVDYLDMYNSSHHSSANISQPSTQESPAGANAAWLAYADFRGSASKLDNDDLSLQQTSACYSDGLDQARRYEMGSFECIDVALEREDSRKVRRGVPKRQIQLKRKDGAEGKQDESHENSSPGISVMEESPSFEIHSREAFSRQHSTPAAMQDCFSPEHSQEPSQQNERRSKLQKSASLEETSTKTKIATSLIKSVLSKKMQSVDKQPDEQAGDKVSPTFEENSPPTESTTKHFEESPKPDADNLRLPINSVGSLSSECLAVRGEQSTKDEGASSKSFEVKSSDRQSSSSSHRSENYSLTDNTDDDSQDKNTCLLRPEIRSEMKESFDKKQSRAAAQQTDDSKTWEDSIGSDSANSTAGNTGASSAIGAGSKQARITNQDQECGDAEDHKRGGKSPQVTRTQEITLKGAEKKKASLSVLLTPEAEKKFEASSPDLPLRENEEKEVNNVGLKTEEEDRNGNNKVKAPIHKVRDVRRLVKNTYNLSFKATSSTMPSDVSEDRTGDADEERIDEINEVKTEDVIKEEERKVRRDEVERKKDKKVGIKDEKILTFPLPLQSEGKPQSHLHPMQIQCKAVCWKEDKYKTIDGTKENTGDKLQASSKPEVSREQKRAEQYDLNAEADLQETTAETCKVPGSEEKHVAHRTDRKPPMLSSLPKLSSKEREVSTAVVLIRDGTSKTKTSSAQEEAPTELQASAPSPSTELATSGSTPCSSGRSVSMLLKEKGYQADIGAVVGDGQNAGGGKGVPRKHINCLEIPLQTTMLSDGLNELHRERTFSSSSTMSGLSTVSDNKDTPTTREEERVSIKPTVKDTTKQNSLQENTQDQALTLSKEKEHRDFEAVKRQDPTFPVRSPALRRFRPQPIEVKSLSKETKKQEMTNSMGNNRPQTIEVKSIAKNSQKPVVPPKPSCKFKPEDLGTMTNDAQKPAVTVRPQGEERSQTIVVSSPTIYRKISNEPTSTSNYTRKVAVSSLSNLKPPSSKITATTISSLSNQLTTSSDTEASNERGQQQHPGASSQTTKWSQRSSTLATAPVSSSGTGMASSAGRVSDPITNHVPDLPSTEDRQAIQPAAVDPYAQREYPRTTYSHEQNMPANSNNQKRPAAASTTQAPGYTHQQFRRSLSGEHPQRSSDLHYYTSDDPPSYDERESFSPLILPDLSPRRSSRYQPSSRHPPCSCTGGCPPNQSLPPPQHHHNPHNLTPPAPPHSPGQTLPYPLSQAPLRPHQCRTDPQPMSLQPSSSPKSSPLGPSQPPAMYQPLPPPPPCPPHPSVMQTCPADRPMQPIDPRRPPAHRSPQQQPPGMAPYSDPGHNHSPGLPPMDPQYLCGSQSLGQSYGSEYGGDSSSLYSESGYGQTPRRVLLDPETGKYFYIEVPMQPLRKMLFDPETGQYVEVLIPQQAMSHSGLYPPSAAPYPSLHNPNMYTPAQQYMPYAAPLPPSHTQTQPQPPRYPEASSAATMHPSGPGLTYRNTSGQGSKPEPPNHPPLDQNYLEGMYYVPTGMNASPNPTPPVYYHKHPPNLPPTGGKRS